MKYILATFIFILSTSLYAGPGLGTGGIGMTTMKSELGNLELGREFNESRFLLAQQEETFTASEIVKIPQDEVEALITRSGDYARLDDIREGFVNFFGVKILNHKIFIPSDSSKHEIVEILLQNGKHKTLGQH